MSIIIVGRGLAGSWLAHTALDFGEGVTLVDSGEPPSTLVAQAMLRPSWFDKADRHLLRPSLALWKPHGTVVEGAVVTRWDNGSVKEQADWYAVEPTLPPVDGARIVTGWAKPVSETEVEVDGELYSADAVVWCDGQGDGKRTYGVVWSHDDPEALDTDFRIHHVAPYQALAGVRYASGCRVGASSSVSLLKAREQGERFFELAQDLGWITDLDGWYALEGTRLKRDQYLTVGEDGWRWSGFHRTGYGVVPALAEGVLRIVL